MTRESIKEHLVEIIIALAILLLFVGVIGSVIDNVKTWNNGYCECGGKWEYQNPITKLNTNEQGAYTITAYIYKCDKCGKMHEFSQLR